MVHPKNLRKWSIAFVVALAAIATLAGLQYTLPTPITAKVTPTPLLPGTWICRGTIINIAMNDMILQDKPRHHNRWYIVTVRTAPPTADDPASGLKQFTVHSPSSSGFRQVGDCVDVYEGFPEGIHAEPCTSVNGPGAKAD